MLVHGAWLTPIAWDNFRGRYEARGYTVLAPAWPFEDRSVEELRRAPDPNLKRLSVGRIVDHYDRLIRSLSEPPIIIGHSFGGLVVQLLADRGLGAAVVAVDPAPPAGIFPGWSSLLSALPVLLTWNGWNRVVRMSERDFNTRFAQTLPERDKPAAYARYVVPAPGRIYFQGALGIGVNINYRNDGRAPLLVVGGERDLTSQPSLVRAIYKKHRASKAPTAIKFFPGRSHWLCAEPGWEEVADYALTWAEAQVGATRRASEPAMLHAVG
jgi:pimeloyl-ACP methyl ester carboxylesterase